MKPRKTPRIYIDFETYSPVDISLGVTAYTAHPAFRAVSAAYAEKTGAVKTADPYGAVYPCTGVFTAHHALFDRAVYGRITGRIGGTWRDTAVLCRYLSAPASLDKAAAFFGLGRKLEAGKKLLKKIASGDPLIKEETRELRAYNKQDVVLLRELDKVLNLDLDPFTAEVQKLHETMNSTGITVDMNRAARLLSAIEETKARTEIASRKRFGIYGKGREQAAVAASASQVKMYLRKKGLPIDSIAEKNLENFLAFYRKKLPKDCADLVNAYREIQSRGADKLRTITENNLKRVYDSSLFHGAHTGRPTGGGVNLFNVKRYVKGDDERPFEQSIKRILKEAEPGEKVKRLSSLLWGCLVPDRKGQVIVRSDLSSIEPRVGAWLRRDETVLDIYRAADAGTGKDEYTIFGESMGFPKDKLRPLSKIVILAACYGMNAERFRAQCRGSGVPDPGEKEASVILDAYHRRNPSVKRTWYALIRAAVHALENGGGWDYPDLGLHFGVEKFGGIPFLRIGLPSGRIKSYAGVKIEGEGFRRTFSYIDPVRGLRQTMYGSMLYENIVQAVAVDVSFTKALEIQKFADVKLNIYDEVNVCTGKKNVSRIDRIMRAPVLWLPGMPVSAKTHVCSSFHKGDIVG